MYLTDKSVYSIVSSMADTDQQLNSKARILAIASRLFYQQGYHATGVNQIIAEAEVAKASFYHHFPSKEALGIAYLMQRRHDWLTRLQAFVEQQCDPQARVAALFGFLAIWAEEVNFRGCAFLNIVSEFPAPAGAMREQVTAHKSALRAYIHDLVKAASNTDLQNDEASQRGDAVYLLFEGAIVESQNFGQLWPIVIARAVAGRLIV